jgi:hypothetical protein
LAAYLYLARKNGESSARTEKLTASMLVDYAADGRPIGVEFTSIDQVDLAELNRVLAIANEEPATPDELAPLRVA